MDAMIAAMRQLDELGVHLAVDDFGTGYSSVADLRRMPIDIIKIDGTFVAGIGRTDEERAVASAMMQLATSLGHRTLAEGIEEASQLAHLRRLGCEFGQGHLLAFPMPLDELRRTHFPPPASG
jgi:EAL domain-containing protein (putative c-di-GMP-specific phosphodiesterase class I)